VHPRAILYVREAILEAFADEVGRPPTAIVAEWGGDEIPDDAKFEDLGIEDGARIGVTLQLEWDTVATIMEDLVAINQSTPRPRGHHARYRALRGLGRLHNSRGTGLEQQSNNQGPGKSINLLHLFQKENQNFP
jgi:hypothetical protein